MGQERPVPDPAKRQAPLIPTPTALDYVQGLPEGYNFLLIFKDGKAQAWKDGEELDLYGDGVYSGDSDWYLPGYENFTAGEGVEDVEVRMAVRQVPIQYLQGQYTDGYVFDGSPLYDLYQGLKQVRTLYLEAAAALAAGIGLLVLAHCLRRTGDGGAGLLPKLCTFGRRFAFWQWQDACSG